MTQEKSEVQTPQPMEKRPTQNTGPCCICGGTGDGSDWPLVDLYVHVGGEYYAWRGPYCKNYPRCNARWNKQHSEKEATE